MARYVSVLSIKCLRDFKGAEKSELLRGFEFLLLFKGHKKRDGDNEDDEHDDEDEDDDDDNEDKGHLSGDWGPGLADCSLK